MGPDHVSGNACQQADRDRVGQIPRNLVHPQPVRDSRDAADLHPSRRQFNKEQHYESPESGGRPDLEREEIGSHNQVPVLRQKFFPRGLATALWRRFDAVPFQNVSERAPRKFVSQVR